MQNKVKQCLKAFLQGDFFALLYRRLISQHPLGVHAVAARRIVDKHVSNCQ